MHVRLSVLFVCLSVCLSWRIPAPRGSGWPVTIALRRRPAGGPPPRMSAPTYPNPALARAVTLRPVTLRAVHRCSGNLSEAMLVAGGSAGVLAQLTPPARFVSSPPSRDDPLCFKACQMKYAIPKNLETTL
jgi:hypothetical protein